MYRYEAIKTGEGTWSVYDSQRKVTIVKSVSPQAKYNEEVCRKIVELLNTKSS